MNPLVQLLVALRVHPDERVAVCTLSGGQLIARRGTAAEAPALAGLTVPNPPLVDTWFQVCPLDPVKEAALSPGQRGADADVARVPCLWADLDVKPGGLASFDDCREVVNSISARLRAQPTAIVETGNGLHPYWLLAGGEDVARARGLIKRFGVMVKAEAARLGGKADSVYDLARVLRVPGTYNCKDPSNPLPVTVEFGDDPEAIDLDQLETALLEAGIREEPQQTASGPRVDSSTWTYGPQTCSYVTTMTEGWSKDNPAARHPWLISQTVRLLCAVRSGCISREGFEDAQRVLGDRFAVLCARPGDTRPVKDLEVLGALVWAVQLVERKTMDECRIELGNHQHNTGTKPPPTPPRRLRVVRASEVVISRIRYLWDRRIPLRAMTLMPGEEGIGKTSLGARIIADTTHGKVAGEFYGVPRSVIVLALEDSLEDVYVPRLKEAGADMDRVLIVRCTVDEDGTDAPVVLPRDLDKLAELVRQEDAVMIWVDSLVTTLPDEVKTIAYRDTAKVLQVMGRWAEAQDVAVVAPWHLNKARGSNTAGRIMDSRAFRTAVRSMLLVVKDPDAPEGVSRGIVMLDKSNGGTLNVPALRYEIRSAEYQVEEIDQDTGEVRYLNASCGVVEWLGFVSPEEARDAADRSLSVVEKDEALEWLRDYLTENGRSKRSDVIAAAAEEGGFSAATVKRASGRLRIHSEQESGHTDGKPYRIAWWSLTPPETEDAA